MTADASSSRARVTGMCCAESFCSLLSHSEPFMWLELKLPSSHPGKLRLETSEVVNATCHAFKSI